MWVCVVHTVNSRLKAFIWLHTYKISFWMLRFFLLLLSAVNILCIFAAKSDLAEVVLQEYGTVTDFWNIWPTHYAFVCVCFFGCEFFFSLFLLPIVHFKLQHPIFYSNTFFFIFVQRLAKTTHTKPSRMKRSDVERRRMRFDRFFYIFHIC